jgi:hypothetical protein
MKRFWSFFASARPIVVLPDPIRPTRKILGVEFKMIIAAGQSGRQAIAMES